MTDRELLELLLQKVTGMEDRMIGMEDKMSGMEGRIANVEAEMATKEDVADIPAMKVAIFETADTVKRIEATQEKHELTLDLLSRRSIDQEAELKQVRQAAL